MKKIFLYSILGLSLGLPSAFAQNSLETSHLVSKIEPAVHGQTLILSNNHVALKVTIADNTVTGGEFIDKVNGATYDLKPNLFRLGIDTEAEDPVESKALIKPDPTTKNKFVYLSPADFIPEGFEITPIAAAPQARRLVDRKPGVQATMKFAIADNGLQPEWKAELREDAPYVRIFVTVHCRHQGHSVREIRVLDFSAPDPIVRGSVKGSPITASNEKLFTGIESPLGNNYVEGDDRIVCAINKQLDLPGHSSTEVSAVLGVAAPGQLRRTFQLSYINEERARPYSLYLNYNTWYDLGFFNRYSEKEAIETIKKFGDELVKKRGVKLDSMLMDDGWDDVSTLWGFHKGWPEEFRNVRKAAEEIGSGPGVWFSPWGGYGGPKDSRINAAKDKGFEVVKEGFCLAGPKYYNHFKNMCLKMIRENGINHFKLDGTSTKERNLPGSRFTSDFQAVISLIEELRKERPDIYINLTTGTWPSPFWFSIADSIWRDGWDHEFVGVGSNRNKWMTFRDANIYNNNVVKAPLFPINSLMTHGIIYATKARQLNTDPGNDLANEIWSGMAYGTQMQEIYISPSLMTDKNWDDLANAVKWARANEATLVDTHWIGGNPAKLDVYGWASWSPKQGIVGLRNPSAQVQTFSFDPAAVFELPAGAVTTFSVSSPNGSNTGITSMKAGETVTLTLQPFQVIVLDAKPQ